MTPEQLEAIKANLDQSIDTAAGISEIIAPQYLAFIVLGQVLAKAVPGLVMDVEELLSKDKPTDEEKTALAGKIASLAHPEDL